MATHKSALKAHRQSLRRRAANRLHKVRMRTAVKRIRRAVAGGEIDVARELLPRTISLIDRTAKGGIVHANAAARTKSRLTRLIARSDQS